MNINELCKDKRPSLIHNLFLQKTIRHELSGEINISNTYCRPTQSLCDKKDNRKKNRKELLFRMTSVFWLPGEDSIITLALANSFSTSITKFDDARLMRSATWKEGQ